MRRIMILMAAVLTSATFAVPAANAAYPARNGTCQTTNSVEDVWTASGGYAATNDSSYISLNVSGGNASAQPLSNGHGGSAANLCAIMGYDTQGNQLWKNPAGDTHPLAGAVKVVVVGQAAAGAGTTCSEPYTAYWVTGTFSGDSQALNNLTFTFSEVNGTANGKVTFSVASGWIICGAGGGDQNSLALDQKYDTTGGSLTAQHPPIHDFGVDIARDVVLPDRTPPGAPSNIQATGGNSVATVSWTSPTDGDLWGENLYKSTDNGSTWNLVNTGAAIPPSTTTYQVTGLAGGIPVQFKVEAVDTAANVRLSTPSNSVTPTGPSCTPPKTAGTYPNCKCPQGTTGSDCHKACTLPQVLANGRCVKPPPKCIVPKLKHRTLGDAKRLLRRAHCKLGKVTAPKHRPHGAHLVVSSQHPKSGSKLRAGYKVSITLASVPRSSEQLSAWDSGERGRVQPSPADAP